LQKAASGQRLRIVNDQSGAPTYAPDLAQAVLALLGLSLAPGSLRLARMIKPAPFGIYHVTNQGSCSWFSFALETFRQAGWRVEVEPINSAELERPALRPLYSALSLTSIADLGLVARPWQEALRDFLLELQMLNPKLFPAPEISGQSEGGNQFATTLLCH
jgi:dTDP-4-dehydrorhamnose reductase